MDINVYELKEKMDNNEDFIFIDVREPNEYAGFNLGAQLIPLASVPDAIPSLIEHKDKEIVVHCRSGARSASARDFMMRQGFSNVRNLTGGVLAWAHAFGSEQI